ncbi:hypothetical protein GCM10017083_09380 [Thalassobaculum fulvum]|jgi:hypothetical protein|uniref:Uncharacterized protein n=1 Tax=Thalassobaculum fulvum TaxID=1633335 RepID=A0A918XPX2_9PROT|nr:hypothetical protein [Thalassobaculum fulvum]GHD43352.1 hypothetical protein GCM10017083_09380 [Thalassobaculum fulvum]
MSRASCRIRTIRWLVGVLLAAGLAGRGGVAVAESVVLTFNGHKIEADGAEAIMTDLQFSAVSPHGAACDDIGDENGVLRCEIPCDTSSVLTKLVQVSPVRRDSYSVTPAQPQARLRGCSVDPARISIVYTHLRHLSELAQSRLRRIVAKSVALQPIDVAGLTNSVAVASALAAHVSDRTDEQDIVDFAEITADLAAYEQGLGNAAAAKQYAAYSTAASNVMIADVARFYGKEIEIRQSGLFGDYFKNVESVSGLPKNDQAVPEVPTALRDRTDDFFTAAARNKKLGFETRKGLGDVWIAHRQLER